jgi:hypothetical protein
MPPISDDSLLSTRELSAAFHQYLNLPMAAPTLETKRSRGNGPPFERYGKIIRYRWGTARDWLLAQRRVLNSTSERPTAPP